MNSANLLKTINKVLDSGTMLQARKTINALHPAETADILEALPPPQRSIMWELIDTDEQGEVLLELAEEVRLNLAEQINQADVITMTEGMEEDDIIDILQALPDTVINSVLQNFDLANRRRLESLLAYDEDSAGGLMDSNIITVRGNVTLDVIVRYLRRFDELPSHTDSLFVTSNSGRYLGNLPINTLLTESGDKFVDEVMDISVEAINVSLDDKAVAERFADHDLVSAVVVDDDNKVLGRITVDDIIDILREDSDHTAMSLSGLKDEEDLLGHIVPSAKRRLPWLGINLLTAILAAWVVGFFEATLEQIVALAVLMPIVPSMGGIAGSQTLTLVIRGLALNQLSRGNIGWLLNKELVVSLINGAIWSVVVSIIAYFWFQDFNIALIIGLALIANMFAGVLAGVLIPLGLAKGGIDPAIAGGVILTTVTDVVGFSVFLGLATLILL